MRKAVWGCILFVVLILAIVPLINERIAWIDLLAAPIAILSLGIGLSLYVIQRVRKKAASKLLFLTPLLVLAGSIIGILPAFLVAPPPVPSRTMEAGEEIRYIHDMDQRDRYTLRFIDLSRDAARLKRILELKEDDKIQTPQDKYLAALVFQHGHDPEHFEAAYNYARAASEAGVPGAEQLSQLAYDRWMLSQGKPQKYGTQYQIQFGGNSE